MPEKTLEFLKRHLDAEEGSTGLSPLPQGFYANLSDYAQRLKRSMGAGNSEAGDRLISRQLAMVETMSRRVLGVRLMKAIEQGTMSSLLPEERFVGHIQDKGSKRFEMLVEAVASGKPSIVEFASNNEKSRDVVIRFVKQVKELVGLDMKRYGPFEVDDLASIPASSAAILVANGDAVEVAPKDDR